MKSLALLSLLLIALPGQAQDRVAAKPKHGANHSGNVPAWLEKDLKPIVKKPVVTK